MIGRAILAAALCAAAPSRAADVDPYACFGWARYAAMSEGFRCSDLPAFCAGARALLAEAGGSRAVAEQLARGRGYSRMSVMLAKRFCR
ncbi:hypothetical protein PMI42_00692 [Bradyrhizobium sp. YR681]|uniref:hypothetical protein n=1 Tax=Bradyrhizobium sp. YR681 TaxID=1144344 RepID=UPI000270DECC|nr:hypothetical protein [Bradyrhizobium sp. YR681]EJN15675.1 hypothetical protein PMI42_00692 [Bradyrhizobium sp. YR681]